MPLLFTEEASSFCHEPSFFLFTQGVLGVDGVYVHCIWVARGGTSSLSALSKTTLPLVPCAQTPLVSHLWAERENGFLGKILAHLISRCLLPLRHGVWPDVLVHDCVECPWSQSRSEGVDCTGIAQFLARFCCQGVERRDVVVD
jgi:hypothetical protein